ncbi:MAG: FkbM family methyltransferase [Candidatus Goldbacteria bacterium]|nr:FkbM family methyltransferase [Candidatus Goldiibacteriota bacterium]
MEYIFSGYYEPHNGLNKEGVKVRVITLNELLKDEEKIDFIKIDAEGHSKEVIFGTKNIIKKFNSMVLYERDGTDIMQFF